MPTQNGLTVTGTVYKKTSLKKNPEKQAAYLLHDNPAAHKDEVAQTFLKEENVVLLPHPLYSPWTSPCDSLPLPRLKNSCWTLQQQKRPWVRHFPVSPDYAS